MYAIYEKVPNAGKTTFKFGQEINLLGRNNGWIPWLLSLQTPGNQDEPYPWHVSLESALRQTQNEFPEAGAIVIDIKPRSRNELLFCELLDVWGYSADDWTPLLLRLKAHWPEPDPSGSHHIDFVADDNAQEVHEFMYAVGTVKGGKLDGTWNPPGPSPTNAVLLWPDALAYFIKCAQGRP
jgi:hypothetical protein